MIYPSALVPRRPCYLTDDDGKELDSCFGFYSPASLIENVRHHLKGAIPKIIGCTDFLSADDLAA